MKTLTDYHIGHLAVTKDAVICKLNKSKNLMTHRQKIDESEVIDFIIEHLKIFEDNTLIVSVDGKDKYKIVLSMI